MIDEVERYPGRHRPPPFFGCFLSSASLMSACVGLPVSTSDDSVSILRWFGDSIDHEDVHRASHGFKPESQLLLQCREDHRNVGIRRRNASRWRAEQSPGA